VVPPRPPKSHRRTNAVLRDRGPDLNSASAGRRPSLSGCASRCSSEDPAAQCRWTRMPLAWALKLLTGPVRAWRDVDEAQGAGMGARGCLACAKSGGPRRQLHLLEMVSYPARELAVARRLDCVRRRNAGSAHKDGPGGRPYQRGLERPPLVSRGRHCRGDAGEGRDGRPVEPGSYWGFFLRGNMVVSVWSLQSELGVDSEG
jgi:hypothetical protein